MRDIQLLRQLNRSYRTLGLRYSRVVLAVCLMLMTALLEMAGLSALYPVVLALGSDGRTIDVVFDAIPLLQDVAVTRNARIVVLLSGVAALYVTKNIVLYYAYRYNISFAVYYYRGLVRRLYSAHIQKPLLEFRKESLGTLANLVCVQTGRLVDGVVRPILVSVTELLLLAAVAFVVLVISPWLLLGVGISCGAAAAVYYMVLRGRALEWGRRRMDAAGLLQELVSNTAIGISEIKVFGRQSYLTNRVSEAAAVETAMFHNLEMYQHGPRFLIEAVFVVAFVVALALVLLRGQGVSVLLAQISVVAAASFRVLPSINRLVGSYSNISFNTAPALRLLATVNGAGPEQPSRRMSADSGRVSDATFSRIELKDVSFVYPFTERTVLKDVNFTIVKGERVGIVGPSGSGKSTLVEILAGLYEPTAGSVLVDGRQLSGDVPRWRGQIGYVPQVPFIMPGTVHENVVFAPREPGQEEAVKEVLRIVGLSEFLATLPDGIETEIGEKGFGLSGGQKQLVCLARALFRRPALLLLDEPTAALDTKSEQLVLGAIAGLSVNTTIVMVTHKVENLKPFDVVHVCADGTVRPGGRINLVGLSTPR